MMDFRGLKPLLVVIGCISFCSMADSISRRPGRRPPSGASPKPLTTCRECYQQAYNDTAMFGDDDIYRLYPGIFRDIFGKTSRGQSAKVCKNDAILGKICYVKNRGQSSGCSQGVSDDDSCCPTCAYEAVFNMAPLASNPAVSKYVVHMPWADMYQSAQLGECGSPSTCTMCDAVHRPHMMLLSDYEITSLFDFLWYPIHWDFVSLSTYCRCLN